MPVKSPISKRATKSSFEENNSLAHPSARRLGARVLRNGPPQQEVCLLHFQSTGDAEFFDPLAQGGTGNAEQFGCLHLIASCFFQRTND